MRMLKRGLGILLLVSYLSCQILPEWCMAIASFAYAAEIRGTEDATDEAVIDEESAEEPDGTDVTTEESPEATKGSSEAETGKQENSSQTPELDRLMEEKKNPNSSGKGSNAGTSIEAKAPEKEIANDEQKDSVGEIIAKKTGTQVLKDLWGGVQELYKDSAKELTKESAKLHKRAKKQLFGASEAGTVKKQERMLKRGNKYPYNRK